MCVECAEGEGLCGYRLQWIPEREPPEGAVAWTLGSKMPHGGLLLELRAPTPSVSTQPPETVIPGSLSLPPLPHLTLLAFGYVMSSGPYHQLGADGQGC